MAKNNDAKPWERQEGESSPAFDAFVAYRDMPKPRSIRAVGRQLGKSHTLMSRWSSNHSWVDRVAAWDDEQDRAIREQQIEDIKKMRKRHAELAHAMLIKAASALKKIPPEEIKPQDVSRMVETASKLERISRGDVETVVEERMGEPVGSPVMFYIPDNHRKQKEEDGDE